jgi:hypothetical protein
MAFLSLLDITSRRGTDSAVGLVEDVITYAPELRLIMGRPIPGTFYTAKIRTSYPSGAFRKANAGVTIGASRYEQRRFDCYFFDTQLQVDELTAQAAEQEGDTLGSLQADEALGAVRQKAIDLGSQVYAGLEDDANGGFPGLTNFVHPSQAINAGGSGAGACERAWLIWMHEQGVHFLFGRNQGMDIKPWKEQQVVDPADSTKRLTAWVSNMSGFIGLSSAHLHAVGCVYNIDNTLTAGVEAKRLTDSLLADAVASFPVGIKPNLILMSRKTRAGLQKSRTVTLYGQGKTRADQPTVAPTPLDYEGIPIEATDSIPLENQVSTIT